MHSLESLSSIEEQLSNLVCALVFVSKYKVIYETESEDLAARCASLLEYRGTNVFTSNNRHFISIDL